MIDQVKYMGHGPANCDSLSALWLLFTQQLRRRSSTPYLERLQTGLGEDADAIWSHCRGYPARAPGVSHPG